MSKLWKGLLVLLADLAAVALLCGGIMGVEYYFPKKGTEAVPLPDISSLVQALGSEYSGSDLLQTKIKLDPVSWKEKFADRFTQETIITADSYSSPNLSIQITRDSYDSGVPASNDDESGTIVSFTVADIYIGSITCMQTGFAGDRYDSSALETISQMAQRLGAVLAVNGDSYGASKKTENGTLVRNGTIYRRNSSDMETCVLNWDGTMRIYGPGSIGLQNLLEDGAYQSWIFGPSLLNEDGKAKEHFLAEEYLALAHPRTAIGYYEPGHYCVVIVDGRQPGCRGVYLDELASIMEKLGCKLAYNLDGGYSSCMVLNGKVANHLAKKERTVSDGILIMEGQS